MTFAVSGETYDRFMRRSRLGEPVGPFMLNARAWAVRGLA
jgi:hypothetical protein